MIHNPLKYILPALLIWGCSEKITDEPELPNFKLEITDSLVIQLPFRVEFVDLHPAKNRFLFLAQGKVLETDRQGNILHQFSPLGDASGEIGNTISAIGYMDSSVLSIFTERGYFFFSPSGERLTSIFEKEKYPDSIYKKMMYFNDSGKNWLVAFHKPFYNPDSTDYGFPLDMKFYSDFKTFTVLNLNNNQTFLDIGLEENSIFLQKENQTFPGFFAHYCKAGGDLALLFNPDTQVNFYTPGEQHFEFKKQIRIDPEHFKAAGEAHAKENDLGKSLATDSKVLNMFSYDQTLGITYSTGIPEDVYVQPTQDLESHLTTLDALHNKRYLMIYQDGAKACTDIPFPEGIASLVAFTGPNEALAVPHAYWIEDASSAKWYFCMLVPR